MIDWNALTDRFADFVPVLATISFLVLLLGISHRFLIGRRRELGAEAILPRQLLMLAMTTVGLLIIVLMFPMSDVTRGQVFSLLGVVLTAVIGLSSATFVSNMMAGIMLRAIKSFRPGDFIRIGDKFGRVTERGLFHTEIQTEDRDLTTFPNMYLVTSPVTVVHSTGTIISATLSLGYDISHAELEPLMKRAAENAGLTDPFVLVTELGDFSVNYRVAGFLNDVKTLVTARSSLRKHVLDVLHGAGIEILSPSYMVQRPLSAGETIIPDPYLQTSAARSGSGKTDSTPEEVMFAKAEEISSREEIRSEIAKMKDRIVELAKSAQAASAEEDEIIGRRIHGIERYIGMLTRRLDQMESGSGK
ncbi:MAG: mechanosensitive ion channel family protein [Gammaproteobacteria bacterium]|nr:mechanosensitive ion channel family protein [Gammaproteobacteria bacterium]